MKLMSNLAGKKDFLAQLVEHRIPDPAVGSSSLPEIMQSFYQPRFCFRLAFYYSSLFHIVFLLVQHTQLIIIINTLPDDDDEHTQTLYLRTILLFSLV